MIRRRKQKTLQNDSLRYDDRPFDYERGKLNIEFNESPQRKKIEKMARKNLDNVNWKDGNQEPIINNLNISGWDGYNDTDLSNLFRMNLKPERLLTLKPQTANRPIAIRANSSFRRDIQLTDDQFQTRRPVSLNQTPQKVQYEPLPMQRFSVIMPQRRLTFLKEGLDMLQVDRQRGWVEHLRNDDRILKVIGGMQSLIVVKSVTPSFPQKKQTPLMVENRRPPSLNSSLLHIDLPFQCLAQPMNFRVQEGRIKQIQKIQRTRNKI